MARKPDDLWDLHSSVDSYVKASKKLCVALVQERIDQVAVLKLVVAIQPPRKIRKLKSYYFFGVAYLAGLETKTALNPLLANLHHRLVRHADAFHELLQELNPNHDGSFDWRRAATTAQEFLEGFAQYSLPQLKAEVEEACRLMIASHSGKHATAKQKATTPTLGDSLIVPELAAEWRCGTGKIYALIRKGELRAINMSLGPGARPRYQIRRSDAERCLQNRAVRPEPVARPARQRRRQRDGVTEYF